MQNTSNKTSSVVLPMVMWISCAIFYGYQYLLQVSPSIMGNDIMRDFGVNATALGNLAATYMYPYAIMQIPAGVLLDNFGTRKLLTIAAILVTVGCLLFGATHTFSITVLGRFFIGLGASFPVLGCMYIAATRLPPKYFALTNGLLLAIGMLGAICGQTPLAILVNAINWRHTMWLFTAIGIAITIKLWLVLKDKKSELTLGNTTNSATNKPKSNILAGLKHILRCKQSWLIALYGGLMYMPIPVLGAVWGVPFLMRKLSIPNTTAGGIITMMFIGIAIGTPLFGWVSDLMHRRKPAMLLSGIGALLSLSWVLYAPHLSHFLVSALLLCFGFFSGGFLVSFAVIREIDTTNSPGTAIGFMNMLNMVFAAIMQPLGGFILDFCWHGKMADGIRFYSLLDYQIALTFLPIGIILAIVSLAWVKETFCKSNTIN
jgi:MFS family permease